MTSTGSQAIVPRYTVVPKEKSGGATYTPNILADFVARKMIGMLEEFPSDRPLRVLDPAVGDGELLICLLQQLAHYQDLEIKVYGFETDQNALNIAAHRLKTCFPGVDENR